MEKKIQTVPTTVTIAIKKLNTTAIVCVIPSPSDICMNITNCRMACTNAIAMITVKIVDNGRDVYNATYTAPNVSTRDKMNPKTCDQGKPL